MSALLHSPKAKAGVIIAAGVVVLAAAWFLLVGPQRSKSAELDVQISAASTELSRRQLAAVHPSAEVTVKAGDLYRLTKALPNDVGMPGILLDVNRLASRNELDFRSVTPAPAVVATNYLQQPLAVIVQGRFGNVSKFLGDLRRLVTVRKGRLDARGRLYSVSQIEMTAPEGTKKFPIVQAKVTVNAYTFSAPVPTQAPDAQTPTTAPSPSGTVAAGATP